MHIACWVEHGCCCGRRPQLTNARHYPGSTHIHLTSQFSRPVDVLVITDRLVPPPSLPQIVPGRSIQLPTALATRLISAQSALTPKCLRYNLSLPPAPPETAKKPRNQGPAGKATRRSFVVRNAISNIQEKNISAVMNKIVRTHSSSGSQPASNGVYLDRGDPQHKCSHCGRSFHRKDLLSRHENRPNSCERHIAGHKRTGSPHISGPKNNSDDISSSNHHDPVRITLGSELGQATVDRPVSSNPRTESPVFSGSSGTSPPINPSVGGDTWWRPEQVLTIQPRHPMASLSWDFQEAIPGQRDWAVLTIPINTNNLPQGVLQPTVNSEERMSSWFGIPGLVEYQDFSCPLASVACAGHVAPCCGRQAYGIPCHYHMLECFVSGVLHGERASWNTSTTGPF